MKESKVINYLQQKFPIIGDDAAALGANQVISKDLLVEDIHFRRRYFDPESLAHKALNVNLSDIAAMAGRPTHVLLGLAIPENYEESYIEEFLQSFAKKCVDNKVVLIGGDTTASPDKLFISVTIIGVADKAIYRSSANIGDIICYTGHLGYAHLGLQALEQNIVGLDKFKAAFLQPNALVQEALTLANKATAMMDVSDGLYVDLQKLCTASNVSAQINISDFSVEKSFIDSCNLLDLEPLSVQLMGGEDYALLFTISPNDYTDDLKKIGIIIEGAGEIKFDKEFDFKQKSFSHFGEL